MTTDTQLLINYIREMKRLGKSEEFIAELLNINQSTLNRWLTKKSNPQEYNLDYFAENYENLFNRKEFIKEVIKKENFRLKLKDNKYEGYYNTTDGRNCYKFVKNGLFEDIEEFYSLFRNTADKINIKYFQPRNDEVFYSGVHGYFIKHGELKSFSFSTNFNTSLFASREKLIRLIKKKFNEDYMDFFEISEFWVHGSYYTNGDLIGG